MNAATSSPSSPTPHSKLFHTFHRSEANLPEEALSVVTEQFLRRADYFDRVFKYLKRPRDLILIVTSQEDQSVYRSGEIIVPYSLSGFLTNITSSEKLSKAVVLRDYFFALAYFDANLRFPEGYSSQWDIYKESHELLKSLYMLYAYADEDMYLKSQIKRSVIDALYGENFTQNTLELQKKIKILEAKISKRNKIPHIRHADTYVFEMHTCLGFLFADLMVSILYNDPNKMAHVMSALSDVSLRKDIPYRSFNISPDLDLNADPLAYKFTHFFAPIRNNLWSFITEGQADREEKLRRLESVFIRMRVFMKDFLADYGRIQKETGITLMGETLKDFLKYMKLDRSVLNERLKFHACSEGLTE